MKTTAIIVIALPFLFYSVCGLFHYGNNKEKETLIPACVVGAIGIGLLFLAYYLL